jgi:predicted permease
VTKLAGVIGAVVGFLLPFFVFDHISTLSNNNSTWGDYVGTAIGIAAAVGGWVVGTRLAGGLKARFARSRTLAH